MTPRQLTERDERCYCTVLLAGGAVCWIGVAIALGGPGVIGMLGLGVLLFAAAARGVGV